MSKVHNLLSVNDDILQSALQHVRGPAQDKSSAPLEYTI